MAVKNDTPLKWPIIKTWLFPMATDNNQGQLTTRYHSYAITGVAEADGQVMFPRCKILKLVINITGNTFDAGDTVVMLRKNGADTTITGSIGFGVTGQIEITGLPVDVDDDDLLDMRIVTQAGIAKIITIRNAVMICSI